MCLYQCGSDATSTQIYHVLPESASNIKVTLPKGVVCDKCNAYFAELENYFVRHHPGNVHRLLRLKQTKKGKTPKLELDHGIATSEKQEDSIRVSIPLTEITFTALENGDMQMQGESLLRSYDSEKISRVLAKIAIESLYLASSKIGICPSHQLFADLRDYARRGRGKQKFVWFCFKSDHYAEIPPTIAPLDAPDGTRLGLVCLITFPGIRYVFPYPPLANETLEMVSDDWTIVTEPGDFSVTSMKVSAHFTRVVK